MLIVQQGWFIFLMFIHSALIKKTLEDGDSVVSWFS